MKESFLGVKVSNQTYRQIAAKLIERMNKNVKSYIVAINPEKIMKAQSDQKLMEVLNTADFQIPDGIGIILASKLKGGQIRQRVTGIDLMLYLCEVAAKNKKSIFLYGGKTGVAEKASEQLKRIFPGIEISGVLNGYVDDIQYIRETISEAQPDIVFVALGSPSQEFWIIENMKYLPVKVFQGVGGSFDVISGNVKRAPAIFRKVGLEWLYRLLKEPVRLKRQIILPKFLIKALKE
jgi:N-acetylglucosaminyldiphosphoundecaprenol N-acetyl-beta-D-mannosaminyltransferase